MLILLAIHFPMVITSLTVRCDEKLQGRSLKRTERKLLSVCSYDSWRRQWHPTPILLPVKSHGWWSLVGCSPWGR